VDINWQQICKICEILRLYPQPEWKYCKKVSRGRATFWLTLYGYETCF